MYMGHTWSILFPAMWYSIVKSHGTELIDSTCTLVVYTLCTVEWYVSTPVQCPHIQSERGAVIPLPIKLNNAYGSFLRSLIATVLPEGPVRRHCTVGPKAEYLMALARACSHLPVLCHFKYSVYGQKYSVSTKISLPPIRGTAALLPPRAPAPR